MSLNVSISPTEQLSLTHDGHIPNHLWQAARQIECAHRHKESLASNPRVRVGRIKMKPEIAVALMADTIVKSTVARGCVHELDFQQVGFSERQIAEYHNEAFALAVSEEPRIVSMLTQDA